MPTYTFRNTQTNEIETHTMRISEYDNFKANNPTLERFFESGEGPAMGDPIKLGLKKPDAGFRDVLKEIKGKYDAKLTRSTINTF